MTTHIPRHDSGFFLVFFAVMLFAFIAVCGLALDFAHLSTTKLNAQRAADAGVTKAMYSIGLRSISFVQDSARKTTEDNLRSMGYIVEPGQVQANLSGTLLRVSVTLNMSYYLMQIIPGFKNAQLVSASAAGGGSGPATIVMVSDVSGSMATNARYAYAQNALRALIGMLSPDSDKLSLIEFGDGAIIRYPMNVNTPIDMNSIDHMLNHPSPGERAVFRNIPSANTCIACGLVAADHELAKLAGTPADSLPKNVLIFTDGKPVSLELRPGILGPAALVNPSPPYNLDLGDPNDLSNPKRLLMPERCGFSNYGPPSGLLGTSAWNPAWSQTSPYGSWPWSFTTSMLGSTMEMLAAAEMLKRKYNAKILFIALDGMDKDSTGQPINYDPMTIVDSSQLGSGYSQYFEPIKLAPSFDDWSCISLTDQDYERQCYNMNPYRAIANQIDLPTGVNFQAISAIPTYWSTPGPETNDPRTFCAALCGPPNNLFNQLTLDACVACIDSTCASQGSNPSPICGCRSALRPEYRKGSAIRIRGETNLNAAFSQMLGSFDRQIALKE